MTDCCQAQWSKDLLTLLLTLCGLTSQKTHRGGLGLGRLVHEEAHPCFPYFIQPPFKLLVLFRYCLYVHGVFTCINSIGIELSL